MSAGPVVGGVMIYRRSRSEHKQRARDDKQDDNGEATKTGTPGLIKS